LVIGNFQISAFRFQVSDRLIGLFWNGRSAAAEEVEEFLKSSLSLGFPVFHMAVGILPDIGLGCRGASI
jgi:hypothetical protein